MTMRVGINGMGRVGRLTLRAALGGVTRAEGDPRAGSRLEVVHVNELKGGAAATAHLLEFDSIQGRWRAPIAADGEVIAIANHRIGFSAAAHPRDIDWGELGCDVVLECTGRFLTRPDLAAYLDRGVKRVIVAAPVKDGSALNIVPHEAEIVFEYRHIPAHDARLLLDELRGYAESVLLPPMRAVHPAAAITFDERPRLAGMDLAEDHPLADLLRALTGANEAGRVAYGTEGGIYQEAGMAAIVCGPGDIAQAHTPDEWIAESELAACEAFLARLADRLAA